MKKHITIKVFDSQNNFQKEWVNFEFEGFSKEINGGLGPCVIILGEKFDYSGSDLQINNEVQIFITDKETLNSDVHEFLIYSGYISQFDRQAANERIKVTLLGYYTKLAQDIYKNGTTTTFHLNINTGAMFREVMARYIAETDNPKLNWTGYSIILTPIPWGNYTFEMMTYRESIDIILSMSPNDWFWYVNAHNLVSFLPKASSTYIFRYHKFVFGKHFKDVKVARSIEKIKNAFLFWNGITGVGEIFKLYSDAVSILKHGRRVEKRTDARVMAVGTADLTGERFIHNHKDPAVAVRVEIIDSNITDNNKLIGYDIETIEPGDVCNFYGFDESLSDIFQQDMMITKVDYKLDRAIVTVEPMRAGVVVRQENIATNVDQISNNGAPTTYTT